jgi:hypothetical protein
VPNISQARATTTSAPHIKRKPLPHHHSPWHAGPTSGFPHCGLPNSRPPPSGNVLRPASSRTATPQKVAARSPIRGLPISPPTKGSKRSPQRPLLWIVQEPPLRERHSSPPIHRRPVKNSPAVPAHHSGLPAPSTQPSPDARPHARDRSRFRRPAQRRIDPPRNDESAARYDEYSGTGRASGSAGCGGVNRGPDRGELARKAGEEGSGGGDVRRCADKPGAARKTGTGVARPLASARRSSGTWARVDRDRPWGSIRRCPGRRNRLRYGGRGTGIGTAAGWTGPVTETRPPPPERWFLDDPEQRSPGRPFGSFCGGADRQAPNRCSGGDFLRGGGARARESEDRPARGGVGS